MGRHLGSHGSCGGKEVSQVVGETTYTIERKIDMRFWTGCTRGSKREGRNEGSMMG